MLVLDVDNPSSNATGSCHLKLESETKLVPLYKQAYHSGFHWSVLVENIESLLKHHRWAGIHHVHPNQEQLFSSTESFLANSPSSNATRRTLLSYVPPRDMAETFIQHYLNVIEPSHQILHLPSFKYELVAFWDRPSTMSDGWLALFFAVLALGCQLHHPCQPASEENDFEAVPSRLFDAAQAFLHRTSFMIRPDLTSIRTLCLFVICRQTRGAVCIELTALWPVTGLIVRLAITLGLHLTHSTQYAQRGGADDTTSRNRLWAAVILLDLRQALAAGMPVIPPSGNLLTENLLGIGPGLSDEAATQQKEYLFPLAIYNYLPQIFKILELATSPQITLCYSVVVKYDQQIKALLNHFHNAFFAACAQNPDTDPFQWTMTNIFIRRVLLALHSRLYREPDVLSRYPVSYWSSLECSLAILSAQRDLWDTDGDPGSESSCKNPPGRTPFIARLLQQDFFLAAITVCFHLVQAESPLSSPESSQGCQVRARKTILELLGSCRGIWEREQDVSVCHGTAFSMIDSLLRIVERGSDGGKEESPDEEDMVLDQCMFDSECCGALSLAQWGGT
ncbi:hypothetical protein CNMCM5623_000505 [Aspergillus felis]|uniref:Xylanolytic transcriptional activator regulatory domain-containing protein n=1 Tax=Aspergillus felis TaxID=1287682 RepID=A0A8H6Q7N7_9EURO|nr:hypothetical protein CNMCM5623_000505 [Aspergillus felis]